MNIPAHQHVHSFYSQSFFSSEERPVQPTTTVHHTLGQLCLFQLDNFVDHSTLGALDIHHHHKHKQCNSWKLPQFTQLWICTSDQQRKPSWLRNSPGHCIGRHSDLHDAPRNTPICPIRRHGNCVQVCCFIDYFTICAGCIKKHDGGSCVVSSV